MPHMNLLPQLYEWMTFDSTRSIYILSVSFFTDHFIFLYLESSNLIFVFYLSFVFKSQAISSNHLNHFLIKQPNKISPFQEITLGS